MTPGSTLQGSASAKFAWGPSVLLDRAVERVRGMKGSIDPELFDLYLAGQKTIAEMASGAGGLVMAAIRVPAYRISFARGGALAHALIPPTYAKVEEALREADSMVETAFQGAVAIRAPFKTLAVAMGLAEFGRNNIAYVRGFGSYVRLRCYLVDADCGSSDPRQQIFLSRGFDEDFMAQACISCSACTSSCPTGALLEDSFPVEAGRCITYLNEVQPPFPAWLDQAAHNCLIGCMRCQSVCPMNEGLLEVAELPCGFGEQETDWLLDPENSGILPVSEGVRRVLDACGLDYLEDVIARNVQALAASGHLRW